MGYFSDTFMEMRRKQWLRSIHEVEACVDGEWHTGAVNMKQIDGDTITIKVTFPSLDARDCTITATRIVDVRGEVAAYQQRLIHKNSGQGTMIKITIPIYEVTA